MINKANNDSNISFNPFKQIQNLFTPKKSTVDAAQKTDASTEAVFKRVTSGAAKVVWVRSAPVRDSAPLEETKAYYTPKASFKESILGSKQRELKREHGIMETIKKRLNPEKDPAKASAYEHLAVESKVMTEMVGLESPFILEVELAIGDYESVMRSNEGVSNPKVEGKEKPEKRAITNQERIRLGKEFAQALNELHKADYSYGDIKPENCLIYRDNKGELHLKLSDFGKAKDIKEKTNHSYEGNLRFAPPEGRQSASADVYSAALVLIRNFEEKYLNNNGDPLGTVYADGKRIMDEDMDETANSKYRGLEKHMVESKAFLATNSGFSLKSFKRRLELKNQDFFKREAQSEAMSEYIGRLENAMKADPEIGPKKAAQLAELLNRMVHPSPSVRGKMEYVVISLDSIFPDLPDQP